MLKKLLFILLFFFCFKSKSQNTGENEIIKDNSISSQLFTKCFSNLNQGCEIFEKYPALKDHKFCSLIECMFLNAYEENDIKLTAEKRLVGIATQLYNEGTPVILIMGIDSSSNASRKNRNIDDDNHIVYISYGECTNPSFLRDAAKIVNKQTYSLINKTLSK